MKRLFIMIFAVAFVLPMFAQQQPAAQKGQNLAIKVLVEEMVELIHNHRMYEANAKAITTQDTMLDKSVNEVGPVG